MKLPIPITPLANGSANTNRSQLPNTRRRDAEKLTGISLTESYAMNPPSSVSGLYLCHPEAKYFNVGLIDRDQIEDYARRMGRSVEETERWLSSHLAYDA